jgi:hypothetical protein
MDKTLHLDSVIKTHQITKEEQLLKKHKDKNKEVKEALERNYGETIYAPFNSGSYAKNTAMNTKFDFDIVSPFKRNAFGSKETLKEMYVDILDFPFLSSMIDENGFHYGEITVTLVTSPLLDVNQGSEYCQSNIDVKFGSYDNKIAVDITQKGKRNAISASNRKNVLGKDCYTTGVKKNTDDQFMTERMLLSYGNKYQPIRKWCVNFDEFTPAKKAKFLKASKNWYLRLEGLYRHSLEEKATAQNFKPTQDFCCIVTIKDTKKRGNIYNEVTGLLDNYSFVHNNIKINQQIEIKINNEHQ